MKFTLKPLSLLAVLLCCFWLPESAKAQQTVAVSKTPAPTLEVQISASTIEDGKNLVLLDPTQPHLNVVLRNISDKPIQLFQEWNSWGFYNLHLEITAVDGKTLAKPLIVSKGMKAWFENAPSTETLASGQSIVREVYFHVPAAIKHPETPTTKEEMNKDLNAFGDEYWFFPLPNQSATKTVTMKAIFKDDDDMNPKGLVDAWTGRIESAPITCEIGWNAPRR